MNRARSSFAVLAVALAGLTACNGGGETPPPPKFAPRPPIPGAPLVYYKLPVTGRWKILRTHYGARQTDQTFALDLIPDATATNRGINSGHPCYNLPIVADAPGVVVIAVDGVPENVVGQTNGYDQHGNYVVIDHQNGEFSLMAHFIPGSLKVRVGQQVLTGQELGRCGNSGNSTLPHVHWQVMDNMNAAVARGIPVRFATYSRNGGATTEMPDKKDTCENR